VDGEIDGVRSVPDARAAVALVLALGRGDLTGAAQSLRSACAKSLRSACPAARFET